MKLMEIIREFLRWRRRVDNVPKAARSRRSSMIETAQENEMGEALQLYLTALYGLCYNLLTEETECRPKDEPRASFIPIGQREMNTLCMDAHAAGVKC